jgi:PAS domain S-box-containing protein
MSKGGILIVEDSFIVAFHLQSTLEGEGYSVLGTCDSGEAAIAFIKNQKPDLVLMDIMLTGQIDGIQTAGIIKEKYSLPVIYITALTDKDTIGRAKVTEPYGYLTKPFEDREIFTVIEMALYKHDIESRLRQSEEKYFSTVNSISDAVITIDRDYCISFLNPTAIAMTQFTLNEAMGKSVTCVVNLKNELTQEVSVNPLQCPIGKGNLNQMPDGLILLGRNGLEVPVGESSLSPLLDNNGSFVGLIMVFKDMTEKRERELLIKELERSRMAALIEGQEKERARIAKDLHDGLGQMLNAIKMNASVIVQDSGDSGNLCKLLDEAITESVRISENLLPAKLRDFDLSICLRSLCTNLEKSTHTHISFEAHGKRIDMPQTQKVNFYRIAQEAVNNSIKHSAAKTITIQLNEEPHTIRLSIEDDGSGMMQESKINTGRNGLVNMRDRAEIMGGKFTIESDPKRGTMIIVEVPTEMLTR